MRILIKEFIGESFELEDAILLKEILRSLNDEVCILDFQGIHRVPTTFFFSLFNDFINEKGRNYILSNFKIVNLVDDENYYRVIFGTSFVEKIK